MKCGIYIAENWSQIKAWVDQLEDDGVIVSNLKSAFALPEAQLQLVNLIIYENALKIQKQLQSHGETVVAQLDVLTKFKEALYGIEAAEKLQKVLEKNPDLEFVMSNPAEFLYAPITSCEVERLFSLLKQKLDDCQNILMENVQKYLFMRL